MTVILEQVMPAGASIQMLDEVTDDMGVDANPPEGMIAHVHFEQNGQIRVVDIWESEQAYETFRDSRLMPAMEKALSAQGMDASQMPLPETSMTPVQRLVRGR